MSDLFKNHIVGFPMRRLICFLKYRQFCHHHYHYLIFQPPQGEHPKEKWEPGEKSPEKKPPKTSGRGKQLARMSKEQLKAQVSVKK